MQENLAQASTELQEKIRELLVLKEAQHELQSTVHKLEDKLRQSKSQHDKIITQCTEEIQHYKNIIDAEKEERVQAQQNLAQVSVELKEKPMELMESQLKFISGHGSVKQKVGNLELSLVSIKSIMYIRRNTRIVQLINSNLL